MTATIHHIGYQFYTDRVPPTEWVYEDYLSEVEDLARLRVAQGLRDDYARYSRQMFAEARAQRIWQVPPKPLDLSRAKSFLARLEEKLRNLRKR
jgi:hypothetical protein